MRALSGCKKLTLNEMYLVWLHLVDNERSTIQRMPEHVHWLLLLSINADFRENIAGKLTLHSRYRQSSWLNQISPVTI